jgi:hypothetical protein
VAEVPASEVVEAAEEEVAAAVVPASEVVEAAPVSVNTLVRRKAKRLRKHQRESLDPH